MPAACTVACTVAWRLEQSRSQVVPSYEVFHDRTLLEIAERRPRDLAELAAVGGVGAAKLERYGEAVLAVVEAVGYVRCVPDCFRCRTA